MIAALIIAVVIQSMTRAEMLAEADDLGRSAAVMGACSSLGYTTYPEEGLAWAEEFSARAEQSGWGNVVVRAAVDAGVDAEELELNLALPPNTATDDELVSKATAWVDAMKAKCHRLHSDHAGLIGDLPTGDRNADARLAVMLAPLN